jgi:phage shock protein E
MRWTRTRTADAATASSDTFQTIDDEAAGACPPFLFARRGRHTDMRTAAFLSLLLVFTAVAEEPPVNPAIDMEGYLRDAEAAAKHRESRRVSEDEFIRMSREPGTVVLDARSGDRFDELHVRGALHLSFTDFTAESLARIIPGRNTRILIYCNNNFVNAERAFPAKIARASLNLSTFVALYSYGYRNVYELAPLLDAQQTKLRLEKTQ